MTEFAPHPTRPEPRPVTPHISVVLCTRDGARWLPQFLESIRRQTLLPDEVVVQDDASTDGTVAIVEAFGAAAPFPVRLVVNPQVLGSTANFERALQRSTGQIVVLADQDDIWYPHKLRCLADILDEDPILTLAFSDADLLDHDGAPTGRQLWRGRRNHRYLRSHQIVPSDLFARRALSTGCTMAVRRRAIDAALPFPPSLADPAAPMRHDRWLSLVAASVGTVRAVPEPLLGFRVHPDQQTGVLAPAELHRRRTAAALAALGPRDADTAAEHRARATQLHEVADRAERLGDFEEADKLHAVAAHHEARADPGATVPDRLHRIGSELRRGGYDRSWLGVAAALADGARAIRRPPEPGS